MRMRDRVRRGIQVVRAIPGVARSFGIDTEPIYAAARAQGTQVFENIVASAYNRLPTIVRRGSDEQKYDPPRYTGIKRKGTYLAHGIFEPGQRYLNNHGKRVTRKGPVRAVISLRSRKSYYKRKRMPRYRKFKKRRFKRRYKNKYNPFKYVKKENWTLHREVREDIWGVTAGRKSYLQFLINDIPYIEALALETPMKYINTASGTAENFNFLDAISGGTQLMNQKKLHLRNSYREFEMRNNYNTSIRMTFMWFHPKFNAQNSVLALYEDYIQNATLNDVTVFNSRTDPRFGMGDAKERIAREHKLVKKMEVIMAPGDLFKVKLNMSKNYVKIARSDYETWSGGAQRPGIQTKIGTATLIVQMEGLPGHVEAEIGTCPVSASTVAGRVDVVERRSARLGAENGRYVRYYDAVGSLLSDGIIDQFLPAVPFVGDGNCVAPALLEGEVKEEVNPKP